jgi:peptidoglycan hydrolase-like protein with peptidoglycan-binding domain
MLFLIMLVRAGGSSDTNSTSPVGCKITTWLRENDASEDVACLEKRLSDLKLDIDDQDNTFGPTTRKSVVSYQKKNGLTIDGIVGPETGRSLRIWGGSSTAPNKTDPPVDTTVETAPPVLVTTPISTVVSPSTQVVVTPGTLPPIDIGLGSTPTTTG